MVRTCLLVLLAVAGVSAAPVPKAEVDPKAVELPPGASLAFVQGKWQIHRSQEPLPRRPEDKADRYILRYLLGPLGAKTGRLIYKAECDTFSEMSPKLAADDRVVLFTSRSRDAYAWYDPKGDPVGVNSLTASEGVTLPGYGFKATILEANSFGAVVQTAREGPSHPLYFVPLKGITFDVEKAVELSDDYSGWNILMDGPRVAWSEGVYEVKKETTWSPLAKERKPELKVLSGDTVVYEARTGKGDEKELIAFDIPTRKELSARPRKPNEMLTAVQDRVGMFFRSSGTGTTWEVFAADLTDTTAKELAVEPLGDRGTTAQPNHFVNQDGLHVRVKDEFQLIRWPAKAVK